MSDDDEFAAWIAACRRAQEDYERRFQRAAADYEEWTIKLAAELVRIAKADEDVPPAGPDRDGPPEGSPT